jgi:hypothetical protein
LSECFNLRPRNLVILFKLLAYILAIGGQEIFQVLLAERYLLIIKPNLTINDVIDNLGRIIHFGIASSKLSSATDINGRSRILKIILDAKNIFRKTHIDVMQYDNDSYLVDFLRINFNQTLHNVTFVIYNRAWLEGIGEHLIMSKAALVENHLRQKTKIKNEIKGLGQKTRTEDSRRKEGYDSWSW